MTQVFIDKELVRQVVSGQTDAFGQLVERHIHGAYAIAYARVGNTSDAEDAVQEAFLRALEKLRSLRDPAKFGSWLLSIARNEAVRLSMRRDRSKVEVDSTTQVVVPDAGSREMNALVREQVMRLPEQHREILLLHYFTGRNTNEIADLLNIRRGAVLKRLQRAREQLAETLLRDLEVARPSEEGFTKQVARISALALAASAPMAVSSATVTAAAGTSAFALKWAVGAALVVVAGASAVWFGPSINPPVSTAQTVAPTATEPAPIVVAPPAETSTPSVSSIVAAAANPDDAQSATIAAASVPAENASSNMSGTWYVTTLRPKDSDEGPRGPVPVINGQFKIDDRSGVLKFIDIKHEWSHEGSGRIVGDTITIDMAELWPDHKEYLHAEGPYVPGAKELKLTGWTMRTRAPFEGYPNGLSSPKEVVDSVWTRVAPDHAAEGEFVSDRADELTNLYDAIVAYYREYQRVPQRLEEMVPRFLPNLEAFSAQRGVTKFSYSPPKFFIPVDDLRQLLYRDLGPENTPPDNRDVRRQKTVELENALRKTSNPDGSGHPLIIAEATYDRYPVTLTLNAYGKWNRGDAEPCGTRPYPDDPNLTPGVDVCEQQLRILTHGIILFVRQSGVAPAGWFTMFFENRHPPCQVTCPVATSEHFSYELLFPSASIEELEETYRGLFGPETPEERVKRTGPFSMRAIDARIPITIEINECGRSGGHHVGFLDGHVELREGRLEDHPDLAPFLNLR